jgi:hypothetical protein
LPRPSIGLLLAAIMLAALLTTAFFPGWTLAFFLGFVLVSHGLLTLRIAPSARRGPFYCQVPAPEPDKTLWQGCRWSCFAKAVMGTPSLQLRPAGLVMMAILLLLAYRDSQQLNHYWPWIGAMLVGVLGLAMAYRMALYAQFRLAKLAMSDVQMWVKEQIAQGMAEPLQEGTKLPERFFLPPIPSELRSTRR